MTKFIFIRHGQSVANLNGICGGQTDFPLSENGKKQAEKTGEILKNEQIDAIYSSDLSRAYDTALAVAKHHNLTVVTDKRLREISRGVWENLKHSEIREKYAEQYNVWITNYALLCCEGGESPEEVQERFYNCVKEISEKHHNQRVVIAAHATAIRFFCAKILNVKKENIVKEVPAIENCALTYVNCENGMFTIEKYNSFNHLETLKATLAEE